MKVKELYNAVALLGFENDIDEESTFFPALNTSLRTVLRKVPIVKTGVLAHYPLTPLVTDSNTQLHGGEGLSYTAEGAKSFYIELSGKGNVFFDMRDSNDNVMSNKLDFPFNNSYGYGVTRCFIRTSNNNIPAKVTVTIRAETLCKVRSVALYGDLISDKSEDIHAPTNDISYDLSAAFSDFGELHEQPKLMENDTCHTLSEYEINRNILSLSRNITGDVLLTYIPAIPWYTLDDYGEEIDIPDDYIGALKLLIASYVWLDDNAERAQYYKSLYNEEIANVEYKRRNLNISHYESVNNW